MHASCVCVCACVRARACVRVYVGGCWDAKVGVELLENN